MTNNHDPMLRPDLGVVAQEVLRLRQEMDRLRRTVRVLGLVVALAWGLVAMLATAVVVALMRLDH